MHWPLAKLNSVRSPSGHSADRFFDDCSGHINGPHRFHRHGRVLGVRWQRDGEPRSRCHVGQRASDYLCGCGHDIAIGVDLAVVSLTARRQRNNADLGPTADCSKRRRLTTYGERCGACLSRRAATRTADPLSPLEMPAQGPQGRRSEKAAQPPRRLWGDPRD